MTERQKQYEILNFKQTLARLNQNIRVDEVTPLDKHIIDAFNGMSDLAKISILMSCCFNNKICLEDNAQQWKPIELVDAKSAKVSETKEELGDIEKANQLELIKLKTWVAKASIVLVGLTLSTVGAVMAMSGKYPTDIIAKNIEFAWKVMSLIFL